MRFSLLQGFVPPVASLEIRLEKEAQRLEKELKDKTTKLEHCTKEYSDQKKVCMVEPITTDVIEQVQDKIVKSEAENKKLDALTRKWKGVIQNALTELYNKAKEKQADTGGMCIQFAVWICCFCLSLSQPPGL